MARKERLIDLNDAPKGYIPVPARQTWGNHSCAGCALLLRTGTWGFSECAAKGSGVHVACRRWQRRDRQHVRYEKLPDPPPPQKPPAKRKGGAK